MLELVIPLVTGIVAADCSNHAWVDSHDRYHRPAPCAQHAAAPPYYARQYAQPQYAQQPRWNRCVAMNPEYAATPFMYSSPWCWTTQ